MSDREDGRVELVRLSRKLMHREAADQVRDLIRKRALWGSLLPSERELAQLLGVSRGTLRKGLDLLEAEELISRQQGQGTTVLPCRELRAGREVARVAVAWRGSTQTRGFYGNLMTGLAEGSSDADWSMSFFCNLSKPEKFSAFLEILPRREIDGLILQSVMGHEMVSEILKCWNGPTVLVDHLMSDLPLTCVIDDSREAGRLAGEHLTSLGHRRIAYIDASRPDINPWRREGFAASMAAAGQAFDEDLLLCCHASAAEGAAAARELLGRKNPPTAVVITDEQRSKGAWRAVEELGLQVGRDIALLAFGDSTSPSNRAPGLTAVEFSARQMGVIATTELGDIMAGRSESGRLVKVPVKLIVRESTQEARTQEAAEEVV